MWLIITCRSLTFYLPPATNPKAPIPGFLASDGTVYDAPPAGVTGRGDSAVRVEAGPGGARRRVVFSVVLPRNLA